MFIGETRHFRHSVFALSGRHNGQSNRLGPSANHLREPIPRDLPVSHRPKEAIAFASLLFARKYGFRASLLLFPSIRLTCVVYIWLLSEGGINSLISCSANNDGFLGKINKKRTESYILSQLIFGIGFWRGGRKKVQLFGSFGWIRFQRFRKLDSEYSTQNAQEFSFFRSKTKGDKLHQKEHLLIFTMKYYFFKRAFYGYH